MFNNKAKGTLMSADNTTLIAKGTEISGEIKFSGCLEIEGTVLGNILLSRVVRSRKLEFRTAAK